MFNKILRQHKAILEDKIREMEDSIQEQNRILANITSRIEQEQFKLKETQNQLFDCRRKLDECNKDIGLAEGILIMQDLGIEYEPNFTDLDDIACEKANVQRTIARLLGSDQIIIKTREYRIDGSDAKGNKFQKTFCENMMISFTTYYEKKRKGVTKSNLNKTEELIKKKFETTNKKADLLGVSINKRYLDLCIQLLHLELDQKIAKAEERERIKEERRRLREQEKLLAEAEKERKRLEEEKKAMNLAYNKALTEEERNKIVEQIQEIDKRIGDIDYRVANPKAGWVYVIESPSLQGMVKIGTSRRLNGPFERVRELSGSSLPEAFKINGFCFSDDAFELENNMHKYFAKQRVNPNKEFFYITPQEAIKVLKEEFDCDVHFVNEEESGELENETN